MQRIFSAKQLCADYLDSFDHFIVSQKGCSPAGVLPLLAVALIVLPIPSIRHALGIKDFVLPLSCIVLGSLFSIATWKAYPIRILIGVLQFLEVSLYSTALISLSASSASSTSSLLSSLWIISVVYWATIYSFSILGLVSVLLGPLVVIVFAGAPVLPDFSIALGAMLFIIVSRITKAKRLHMQKTIGVLSILDNAVDMAADIQRSSVVDIHNLKLISILHKAKNDLTPAKWNLEYLAKRGTFSDDLHQVINETKECIDSTLDDLYTHLEKYRSRSTEIRFFHFSDLVSELRDQLISFPHLNFSADDSADPLIQGRIEDIRLSIVTLVENSANAGASKCELKLGARDADDRFRLLLRDNGTGLPSKVKEHMFEPFNSYGKRNGVGLGLYLSSRLISANAGELSLVQSSAEGTEFQLELSLYKPLRNTAQ
jgi:signal transduction histidine kinase